MTWCLVCAGILLGTGLAALLTFRHRQLSVGIGTAGAVTASAIGLVSAIPVLLGAEPTSIHLGWNMPLGSFSVELDALSAFFLAPILLVAGVAAVYGSGYLLGAHNRHAPGPICFFFNVLVAAWWAYYLLKAPSPLPRCTISRQ